MSWLEASTENCLVQRLFDVLGEKWTLLILRDASTGVRRFDEFRRRIGLSDAVLSNRLRKLTAVGILERVPYKESGSRSRHEYHLTRRGWELWPALVALEQWGEAYDPDLKSQDLDVRHDACGAPVRVVVECSGERTVLTPADVSVRAEAAARSEPRRPRETGRAF